MDRISKNSAAWLVFFAGLVGFGLGWWGAWGWDHQVWNGQTAQVCPSCGAPKERWNLDAKKPNDDKPFRLIPIGRVK